MAKKILKTNSYISIIVASMLMLLFTIYAIYLILMPSEPNSWDDLGKFFVVIGTFIVCLLTLPLLFSGIGTLNYLKGKNAYKSCTIFDTIGIILYGLFIFSFVYIDILGIFNDYYNGNVYTRSKIIFSIITFLLLVCPLIINIIGLYKDKNNLTYKEICHRWRFAIIGIAIVILIIILYNLFKLNVTNTNINKINVTENNTYSYSDFKSQLESRNLIYELPENKVELTGQHEISALDSSSKYGYTFSNGSYTDSYRLSVNTDRKFPMFVYDSYASLIKKSDKTADYYYIGPEDWYITWYIYYINGKIYAAIGDESEYENKQKTSLSTTKYGVVVSEEDDITIYNSNCNYFVKGGGILDTRSGEQRSGLPTTTDIYDENCMKIKVVNKIDAKTLDEIAKDLSSQ